MPITLHWQQVALRLALTAIAGIIIGFNRGEHGRPAGMRTTLLVCLAAAIAMIQANLLMNTVGKARDSFIVMDLMRLPLGILSGMGFIGAGAILRKDSLVLGVTTAATLWFSTVMGLCFGGGQLGLGGAALGLGIGTLWGLKHVERAFRQDMRATFALVTLADGPSEAQVRQAIAGAGCQIIFWGVTLLDHGQRCEMRGHIQRRVKPDDTAPPPFIAQLSGHPKVLRVMWRPQGIGAESRGESAVSASAAGE
jgi:putative Mg2+ transporter-C (MgtC) family protein